jgi:alpha-galactosidase
MSDYKTFTVIKNIYHVFISLMLGLQGLASGYTSWDGEQLILDNGRIKRVILWDQGTGSLATRSMNTGHDSQSFTGEDSKEFHFLLNDGEVTGLNRWSVISCEPVTDETGGQGCIITLAGEEEADDQLEVSITYLLYPELPLIRKKMTFRNTGGQDFRIEALDVEHLKLSWSDTHCWTMKDYGRYKHLGPYVGDWNDVVVTVHNIRRKEGMVLGNEAPGVTKRTTTFLDDRPGSVTIGLCYPDQDYPFRKWLAPGEQWESPYTFVALYRRTADPYLCLNTTVADFTRKHMGIRLAKLDQKPAFVYNTWKPFRHNINDTLIYELAAAAAACGVEEFIIDDGWQTNAVPIDGQIQYGDWEIDRKKFPEGLKPVFDSIKALGMKPGLWISMAGASPDSRVFQEHPEWFVQYQDGILVNLHSSGDYLRTACFGTGWVDHIKSKILYLVREHGLEYAKLDFAIVTSAYRYDRTYSGCYATDHPFHRDRPESFLNLYRRAWQMYDELHEEAPDLFIDCTFETMGALQAIDYDMCKHAEGNWLSNFESQAPLGSHRVRQMSWWRTPAIPAAALVIGNQQLDDPDIELSLMSQAGSFPIFLGDPRALTAAEKDNLKRWSDWLREVQDRHDYMMYRQDLQGFGEPQENQWDGFQRINTDTRSGGIVGVFRQGGRESRRQVIVQYLEPSRTYQIKRAPEGTTVGSMSGQELRDKGFTVELVRDDDGALFEIRVSD